MKYIAWAITGGGSNLRSVVNGMLMLKKELNVKVSTLFSRWGYEVVRIFGVLSLIKKVSPGGYYEEMLTDDEAMYVIGRFNLKRYDLLIVAPATANTIAKMVYGIADTSPTAAYAQAMKSGIPVVILPTDVVDECGRIVTESPCYVDRTLCKCLEEEEACHVAALCPVKAIEIVDDIVRINLSRCIGCEVCAKKCPYNAIKCWEKITLLPRDLDLKNINSLRKFKNTYVVSSVEELLDKVKKLLRG